jgi:hypothetical protein
MGRRAALSGLEARGGSTADLHARLDKLAMVFKLAQSAERHWRRLDGSERLAQVIEGVRFRDGEPVQDAEERPPPDPVHQTCA